MRLTTAICLICFLCLNASAQVAPANETRSLGDVARELREQRRRSAADPQAHSASTIGSTADINVIDPDEYKSQISEMLFRRNFDGLEQAAETARSRKSRFPGGLWALFSFYEAASAPAAGSTLGKAAWDAHITLLRQWASEKPQSNTALIALAAAYLTIGRNARGQGYADQVTDEGWQSYAQNAELARLALEKAFTLPAKCPYWYEAMVQVALAQGWSKARTKALFEDAFSFDPAYYHTIREYANYLQPKWYGSEGEVEAFAEEISKRIGGEEGDIIYFEIASLLGCDSCGDTSHLRRLSWLKVKNGYAALERRYDVSNLKVNRFAFMATKMNDKPAARDAFIWIGNARNPAVWRRADTFFTARTWALKE